MSSEHLILNAVIDNLDIVKSLRKKICKLEKKNKKLKNKNKALKDIIYNRQYNNVSVKKEVIDLTQDDTDEDEEHITIQSDNENENSSTLKVIVPSSDDSPLHKFKQCTPILKCPSSMEDITFVEDDTDPTIGNCDFCGDDKSVASCLNVQRCS